MHDKLWITPGIKTSSKIKNKLYKKWLLNNSPENLEKYKLYKNLFTKIVHTAKRIIMLKSSTLTQTMLRAYGKK